MKKPKPTVVKISVSPVTGPPGPRVVAWTNAPKGTICEISDGQSCPSPSSGNHTFEMEFAGSYEARIISYATLRPTIYASVLFTVTGGIET